MVFLMIVLVKALHEYMNMTHNSKKVGLSVGEIIFITTKQIGKKSVNVVKYI